MKTLLTAGLAISIAALTGCTTVSQVIGRDKTGSHDIHTPINNRAPVSTQNGILVDADKHMTLYVYDKDTPNTSNCNAICLAVWPAFLAPSGAMSNGAFSTILRNDGHYQWALNGKPLYFYANDTEKGDRHGDGKMGVWHVVPAGY